MQAAVPEVLITAQSYGALPAYLANVRAEAHQQQAAWGGATKAEVLHDINLGQLGDALRGRKVWCFAGHGDAPLQGEKVPAFVYAGSLQAVSIDTLVEIVKPHVLSGDLEMIIFTGCCTFELARQLHERALVPYCVCWASVLYDPAGPPFGEGCAKALAAGKTPQEAFDAGCAAVHSVTELGYLDTGVQSQVQKFELNVDPMDTSKVFPRNLPDERRAHRCRLKSYAPNARRGRIAAGVPRLLEPAPIAAPPLPRDFVTRPNQKELRDALIAGIHREGAVVGIVGAAEQAASSMPGLSGTPGLGKTTTARWLCHDLRVRVAFRDGIHWLEFGKARTATKMLTELVRALGVPREKVDELEHRGMDDLRVEATVQLQGKHSLIVLDDVWDEDQPLPFSRLAGGGVVVLLTTRKGHIIETFGDELSNLKLQPFDEASAVQLLVASSGKAHADLYGDDLNALVKLCDGLPAMLCSVGKMCGRKSAKWARTFFDTHKLHRRLPLTMARADGYQVEAARGNLFLALQGQLDGIAEDDEELVHRCTMLGVFPEDTLVPVSVLCTLWQADPADAMATVEKLVSENLIELDADAVDPHAVAPEVPGQIQLTDPVRDYLRCRGKTSLKEWNAKLLRGCQACHILSPDPPDYAPAYWLTEHVLYHLHGCEDVQRGDIMPNLLSLHLEAGNTAPIFEQKFHSSPLPSLAGLSQLHTLRLISCRLEGTSIPGLRELVSLQKFHARACSFTSLQGLEECLQLQTLRLECCSRLHSLPEGLGRCKDLREVFLHDCSSLRSLPGLGECGQLARLDVDGCVGLMSLPDLSGLSQLQVVRREGKSNTVELIEPWERNRRKAFTKMSNHTQE